MACLDSRRKESMAEMLEVKPKPMRQPPTFLNTDLDVPNYMELYIQGWQSGVEEERRILKGIF